MKRVLLPTLVIVILLLSACVAPTTVPTPTPTPTPPPSSVPTPTPIPTPTPTPTPMKQEFKAICAIATLSAPEAAIYEWFIDEAFKRTDGRLQIELKSLSSLRIHGSELTRALRSRRIDFGEVLPGYVTDSIPTSERIPIEIEGVSLPGLFDNWDKTEQAYKAWQGVLKKYENEMGGYFLGSATYHNEYLYSNSYHHGNNHPIEDLDDMERLLAQANRPASNYLLEALKASTVRAKESQIYEALGSGLVSAAAIGSFSGYELKLYEVTDYLIDLQLGTTF